MEPKPSREAPLRAALTLIRNLEALVMKDAERLAERGHADLATVMGMGAMSAQYNIVIAILEGFLAVETMMKGLTPEKMQG